MSEAEDGSSSTARDGDPLHDEAQNQGFRPLKWWVEIGLTLAFYVVYSAIRNQFGSALGDSVREESFRNAERVIDLQRSIGLYFEERVHTFFLEWDAFIVFWNVFYGTFHFAVTVGAMVILFARYPRRYTFMRSTLAATTTVALVGFAFFPLMPPRLLGNCDSRFGACEPGFDFVDTLVDPGGLWSFESGTMETISNQYAAMPSLHVAWAVWCTVALYPVPRSRWSRRAIVAYPILTLFAIVVTANHYWIDGIGGVLAVGFGWVASTAWERRMVGRHGGTETPSSASADPAISTTVHARDPA